VLKQEIRMDLLESYARVEKAIKVKSKALYYLLKLFGEDIPQMLQYFVQTE
jgi:hypothetical protein